MSNTGYSKGILWDIIKKYTRDPDAAVIYHCYNHYNNVAGFLENKHYITNKIEKFILVVDSSNGSDI
jgi:hypothetical protein